MNVIARLITLLALCLPSVAFAVDNATDAFKSAPAEIFPAISSSLRLDMLDYYNGGYNNFVQNDFNEPVRIDSLTSDYIKVRVADNSTVEMTLMPLSAKDTAVVVITTLKVPATASFVKVYHGDWVEYSDVLPMYNLTDWVVTTQDADSMADIENMVPFIIAKLTIDPATRTLTATNTLSEYFTPDDYARLQPIMRPALTYQWKGKKFRLLKP